MFRVLFGGELLEGVVREIWGARKSVEVVMFEWSWYPGQHTGSVQDINRELCIKAKEGVEVKVLLHNESMGRALHRINRATARHLTASGAVVKWGNTGKALHAKVWIFDRARVIVGSHNISVRSTRVNEEVSVLFDDAGEVSRVGEWFAGLWGKGM
jgi:phosphatidylserine/phosphatidylglycerophosphate/cardiolipin synthase-like enzyme